MSYGNTAGRPSLSFILTEFEPRFATEASWQTFPQLFVDSGKVRYICSQLELCPDTLRLHVQTFVKFISKQRYTCIQKISGTKLHCTPVTVEGASAINYGCKEETRIAGPFEFGEKPLPSDRTSKGGSRTKEQWEEVRKVILTGDRQAVPVDLVIKHNLDSRFDKLRSFWTPDQLKNDIPQFIPNTWNKTLEVLDNTQKKRHYWIFSRASNFGKTTFAKKLQSDYVVYIKAGDYTYWDFPRGKLAFLILEDYNEAGVKFHILNLICDGTYEFRIFQGGVRKVDHPFTVIVLSNYPLREIYPHRFDTLYARFNEVELI
uniref:Replication protein n=1 Tax=Cruciviridae sp. TaxID=1955495 RepID=A0A1S6LVK2_9VIRU|nr:replication protein [Cruciviridae sp.]